MSVIVHTTPPLDGLPASDGGSIRLIGTIRLAGVQEQIRTAGWDHNGKAYVTLDGKVVPRSELNTLPGWTDPDAKLDADQRADAEVWKAYVDEVVVDLVNHSLYSLPPNWPHLAKAQLATLSFPMTQYVPDRLRSIHAARLKHVGVWGLGGVHDGDLREEDQKRLDESFVVGPGGTKVPRGWSGWHAGREIAERRRKFGEKVLGEKYEAAFGPLARKLGKNKYFYGSKPSSLDVALWAQLALVLDSELPNDLLARFLGDKYPELVNLHHRLQKNLFPQGWPERLPPPTPPTLYETVTETVNAWWPFTKQETPSDPEKAKKASEDTKFKYARWAFFAGATAAVIGYVFLNGLLVIDFGDEDDEEWEEEEIWVEDEEDDGEEELEEIVEALEHREPSSGLPVWEDGEEGAPEEEISEEEEEQRERETARMHSGLPVWDDDEEEEAERQRQENAGGSEEEEDDSGPSYEEPSEEEEIIGDFNPATAEG